VSSAVAVISVFTLHVRYNSIMQINLRHPDLERFIVEQVKAGRFKSADDVIATALARTMDEDMAHR
jgi:hypothetical protein